MVRPQTHRTKPPNRGRLKPPVWDDEGEGYLDDWDEFLYEEGFGGIED